MSKEKEKIALHEKKEKKLGIPNLTQILANSPFRTLNPILIQAYRDRTKQLKPKDILTEAEKKEEFYGPSTIDQRKIIELGSDFYSVVPGEYEGIELSPITPLGLNSVISKISQDISLSTIRGSEVISDPTTTLALESAKKRKKFLTSKETIKDSVNLATTGRVLRLQPFGENEKGYLQHFNLFALCTAGRDYGSEAFMIDNINNHISIWLNLIQRFQEQGNTFNDVVVKLSDISILEQLIEQSEMSREDFTKQIANEEYHFFKETGILLPSEAESISQIKPGTFNQYGLGNKISYLKALEKRVLEPLREIYPNVKFCFDFARKEGLGYYSKACYHIFASNKQGLEIDLADGGDVNWVSQFLSSKKERAITSGFGMELMYKQFLENK